MLSETMCRHRMVRLFQEGDKFNRVILMASDIGTALFQNSHETRRALHGGLREFQCKEEDYGLGCTGLQELSLLMRSDVWDVPDHLIDPQFVIFRTPLLAGRTSQSIEMR
jgi:hypothetical protein